MSTNDLKPAADAHASQRIELSQAQRIVVKVGSAMLTHPEDGLAKAKIAEYCAQLHGLKEAGREVGLPHRGGRVSRGGEVGGGGIAARSLFLTTVASH